MEAILSRPQYVNTGKVKLNEIAQILQKNTYKFIKAEWCVYASEEYTIIGSDNGLSPVMRHAII